MLVELVDIGGTWHIQDSVASMPTWGTGIQVTASLQEKVIPTTNKRYIKDALKLKEAGFEADEVLGLLKEAHA